MYSILYDGGYVYFELTIWDADTDEARESLSRIDVNTGEVEFLCVLPEYSSFLIRGNVMFHLEDSKTIYTTDLYNNNKVNIFEAPKLLGFVYFSDDGSFIIYQNVESLENDDLASKYYKLDIQKGETIKLFETPPKMNLYSPLIMGEYLYYTFWSPNVPDASGRGINIYSNQVYRAKLDGSGETELIYEETDEDINIIWLNTVGKYLVANTQNALEKLVFDTETGEVIRKPGE